MSGTPVVRQSDLASTPAPAPDPALARGTGLGRFVVLGLVGRGAMGEVYGAYDPDLDRKIAIKLVRARVGREGDTADSRTRLMREAQATAKISHPNVVVVYDAGTFGDRVFIAMEFVEGHTLRFWLQAKERTWPEILEAFLAAGRGLAAAHEKELVHRDFKPDNVMVATTGQVRVMDFGLARMAASDALAATDARQVPAAVGETDGDTVPLDITRDLSPGASVAREAGAGLSLATTTLAFRDKITQTGIVLGTPAYMSPEQFQSRPTDARSDQFSFCVALYEALYGARPFAGRTMDELAKNVVAGRIFERPSVSRVPSWVGRVLERGLRAAPGERFPSMNALLAELEKQPGAGRSGFASGAAAKLAGVWEAPVAGHPINTPEKDVMKQAFLATGKAYAATAFVGASVVLDRYAQLWTELYVEVCEATHVRGEQSAEVLDLRMAYLMESLEDLKALCRLFHKATAEVVENAVNAATGLGTLDRCRDVKLLRAVVRPPEDPTARAAVDSLRARLVDLRALSRVGKFTEGLEAAGQLVEDARRVGYGPMLAEILFVYGNLQHDGAMMQMLSSTLEDAVWTAELARHDEVAAGAASHLVYLTGYLQGRFEIAEIWSRHAEAILRRMGSGHDQLWGWYFNNRGAMRERQGRIVEGIADMRLAVAAKERAAGADAPDLALSIGNLALYVSCNCAFEEALAASARALEIMMTSVGLHHPRTAVVLAQHGQILWRLARFEEAEQAAASALATFERESNPNGLWVTFPLRTLGLCLLSTGRFAEAARVLDRAVAIRDALATGPLRRAEARFPLARALLQAGDDGVRAVELARQARREYEEVSVCPIVELDRAELDAWLASNG